MEDTQDFPDDISVDSQLEWELDQGIPQHEDPFIQKYMDGRAALIAQEKKQRHDHAFKRSMSPFVRQAANILATIRKRELEDVWNNTGSRGQTTGEDDAMFPGMMFTLARERLQSTELWKIIQKMPKGALLHCHLDAMFDIDWLYDQLVAEGGIYISAAAGLSDEKKRKSTSFGFTYGPVKESDKAKDTNIWGEEYVPQTLVPLEQASSTFPGEENGFRAWVISRCMITAEEAIGHQHGLNAVWAKFQSTFPIIGTMLFYEPVFRRAFSRLLHQLAADGITYVDFRMAFVRPFTLAGKTEPEKGYMEFIQVFGDELDKFKKTEAGKNFTGGRMIWTIIRAFDNKLIAESMEECIRIKQRFPDLICGFDCVGQEDGGRTLQDLTPMLFWFKKKCHEAGVDLPFFFHAGECLGDGDSTDSNLFDAILLGTRRIGHGYSLYKHPLLIDMVKDKKILVESCPISNEILRLTSSILSHSLPALLARGVVVSLNNDDPANLGHGSNGLSHDFWQAFMGFENLGLEGLATMAENSLRWCAVEDQKQPEWIKGVTDSYLGDSLKANMLQQWRAEFHKWCQWIVMEYVLDADDDGDDEDEDADVEGV